MSTGSHGSTPEYVYRRVWDEARDQGGQRGGLEPVADEISQEVLLQHVSVMIAATVTETFTRWTVTFICHDSFISLLRISTLYPGTPPHMVSGVLDVIPAGTYCFVYGPTVL